MFKQYLPQIITFLATFLVIFAGLMLYDTVVKKQPQSVSSSSSEFGDLDVSDMRRRGSRTVDDEYDDFDFDYDSEEESSPQRRRRILDRERTGLFDGERMKGFAFAMFWVAGAILAIGMAISFAIARIQKALGA